MVRIAADPIITKANIGTFEISPLSTSDSSEAAVVKCRYWFDYTTFIFLLLLVTPIRLYLEQKNE